MINQTSLELTAPTPEEAIEKGLSELGLRENEVEIEILEQGSRGLFGLGSKLARVRITTKLTEPKSEEKIPHAESLPISKEQDHELQVARVVVETLLEKMKVQARVATSYIASKDEQRPDPVLFVEVLGDDLSILIGRRSETLSAIQHISSLIIGRELNKHIPVMIDVQGYRSRREQQLRQLAQRMAEQAVSTGRRQVLEPMPASERRVIHLALREHGEVVTESIGEEPYRKVTITVKKS
jgi:spoIIIJ-associated protein